MPLNMDIKSQITSSSEPEQIHSGEGQEIQDQHNATTQNANISCKKRNFSGDENDEIETMIKEDDQNCSIDSAIITQLNVKTEPEDVDTSEAEILGITEMRKRKAPSNSAEHTPHTSEGITQQNVKSEGESSDSRELEPTKKKKVTEEPVFESSRYNQDPAQIPDFNNRNDQEELIATSTSAAAKLTNKIAVCGPCLHPEQENPPECQRKDLQAYFSQFGKIINVTVIEYDNSKVLFDNCDSAAKSIQEGKHKIQGQDFFVWAASPTKYMKRFGATFQKNPIKLSANLTNRISVAGPYLHPEEMNPKASQIEEFRAYFSQFGKVTSVSVIQNDNSKIAFDNCGSAAKCIQQGTHNIRGQDFLVCRSKPTDGMKKELRASLDGSKPHLSSENVTVPNNRKLPAGSTNRISVAGPCLHPEQVDPTGCQKRDIRAYFRQFGQIIDISLQNGTNATIAFDSCDSAAKCLQQDKHKICGQDFIVCKETPSKHMSGPSNETMSAPNIQSNPPAESNLGNQLPQATASSSSQVHGSVMDYSPLSDKPAATKLTNRIVASGPCLNSQHKKPKVRQGKDLRAYFSQFGKIISIDVIEYENSKVVFDNCDSAAKCLQQDKHKIGGHDFIVRRGKPTKSMRKEFSAILHGNTPHSSSKNMSVAIQVNSPAESQVHGNVVDSDTISRELSQNRGLPSFDKPGWFFIVLIQQCRQLR
ncbi:hypothetical protein Ddc_20634 [Ditylenchus destructor]|nr:hypothetical protein Ddc_20634 [Ditylenchus destructor]